MGARLPQNSSTFSLLRCQGIVYPWVDENSGPNYDGANLFSMKKFSIKNTPTFIDTYAMDADRKYLAYSEIDQMESEVSCTLMQNSHLALSLAHFDSSISTKNTQTLAAGVTFTLPQAKVVLADAQNNGGYYQIRDANGFPVQGLSNVSITYGLTAGAAPITLVAGTDYHIDLQTGVLWGLKNPATFATATDLVVTYDAIAVTANDGLFDIGGLAGGSNLFSLSLLGVNRGIYWRLDINKLRLGPSGDADLQNDNSTSEYELSGKIFSVNQMPIGGVAKTIPSRYAFYRLQQLK